MPIISSITNSKNYSAIEIAKKDEEPEYKGTTMVFAQYTAPTGWTQVDVNDYTLRITSGDIGTGGNNPFLSSYPSTLVSFAPSSAEFPFDAVTHYTTVSEMPAHVHYGHSSASPQSGGAYTYGPVGPTDPKWPTGYVNVPSPTAPLPPPPTTQTVGTYISPLGSPTSTGAGHSHSFTGGLRVTSSSTVDLRIKYVVAIIATKNIY